ncbi:hypothetical protein [Delftia sp. RIT313]|jgi:hypothetical protein|uniref:hypothetical protein n=1 Tax=Delftia sp. RIT313 TaxID=1468410 RepID=UPI00044B599B|nr:hypothetical protein [Delftia sp. RIT313]EZP50351.1 hypothetical protein BW39_04454 [Delftia sp. RIT313]
MSFDPITNAGVKALQGQVNTVQSQTTALTTKLAQIESALANLGTAQAASRKPLRVTEYTSGSGMHVFLPESSYQYILLIGAGGGGGNGYRSYSNGYTYWGSGGAAGDELYRRVIFKGGIAYQVGIGGVNNGGQTQFGNLWVAGGVRGNSGRTDGDASPTTVSSRQGYGITPGNTGTLTSGGDSLLGKGGANGTPVAGNASGYGAGGGGTYGHINPTTPSPGMGGYIRIEEY